MSHRVEMSQYERKNLEEKCFLSAMNAVLKPMTATEVDAARLRHLMRDVFPSSMRPASGTDNTDTYSPMLIQALEEQLKQENLQPQPDFISKVRDDS